MSHDVPAPMQNWLARLPSQNVGTFYAVIRPPLCPFGIKFKVPVWGQVCDGKDHRMAVETMLYNYFPLRGRGWTYVAWRTVPDNPDACKYPRQGVVVDPKPYSGKIEG